MQITTDEAGIGNWLMGDGYCSTSGCLCHCAAVFREGINKGGIGFRLAKLDRFQHKPFTGTVFISYIESIPNIRWYLCKELPMRSPLLWGPLIETDFLSTSSNFDG